MGRAAVFFGVLLGAVQGAQAQETYPAWFWTPPPGSAEVFARSEGEAVLRGAQVITAYRRCEVLGNFQQLYDQSIDDQSWRNTDYHYDYDPKAAEALAPHLDVRDRFPVDLILGQNLYLVGPSGSSGPPDSTRVGPSTSRPAWADLVGTWDPGSGRWPGVGRFTLQGNPADAWIKAEELAVFHMLQARLVEWGHTVQVTRAGDLESTAHIEWVRLSYWLSQVTVDSRWVDPETGMALVTVSAPPGAIQERK